MNYLQKISSEEIDAGEYATRADFCRVFTQNLNGLYHLALLLTGDPEKAEQCFVGGLDDVVNSNKVFKDWAHSWAKRAIIKNAILALRPQPTDTSSSAPANVVSKKSKLRIIRDGHLEIDSVLALEDFERFVYVMAVLERYSEPGCALLIGCSIEQVHAARIRAVEEIARIARNAPFYKTESERRPGQLSAVANALPSAEENPGGTREDPTPNWSRDWRA